MRELTSYSSVASFPAYFLSVNIISFSSNKYPINPQDDICSALSVLSNVDCLYVDREVHTRVLLIKGPVR